MTGQRWLQPLLDRSQRRVYGVAVALWCGAAAGFWLWWLHPAHNIGTGRYVAVTAGLVWLFAMQAYFLLIFLRARRSVGRFEDLGPVRVAMVTTKTPAEPFDVLRGTLAAMLAQDVPHDTWLADEDPSAETRAWCAARGVQISTRKGEADYHRAQWPRRTRCKEGNLAFFYDHFGYDRYDFVAQLDADHVPAPGYLRAILGPFADPAVGYVSAPSICAANAAQSWAARTRLYAEGMFHGVLQAGYSNGWAPMCIGSHYAVRTRALCAVGGLGPDLAEDHSTSMILNAGGWRGVHAIDAIAVGAGPSSLADLVTQEFQWSRSLVTLLLRHTPRYLAALSPVLRFQFVFCQLWYPMFALFMLMFYAIPLVALMFDIRFAGVTYPAFLAHMLPPMAVLLWIAYRIRRDGLFRPVDARVIAWEKALFVSAQWPWVLWGCVVALRDRLTGGFVEFRVTPKGARAQDLPPLRVLAPYAVLAVVPVLVVLGAGDVRDAQGFYLLALLNAALFSALLGVILIRHLRENRRAAWADPLGSAVRFAGLACLAGLMGTGVAQHGMVSMRALTTGLGPLQVTQTLSVVAGAGQGGQDAERVRWHLSWEN